MSIQPENQQYKKPLVPPTTPDAKDGDFRKTGFDPGKKVSPEVEDDEKKPASDSSDSDDAGQDHE